MGLARARGRQCHLGPEDREYIKQWWGVKPLLEIAAHLRVSKAAISYNGKKMGLPTLPRGGGPHNTIREPVARINKPRFVSGYDPATLARLMAGR